MLDITPKSATLRTALAEAVLRVSSAATMTALTEKKVPKGDVLERARTAGLFAAKKTPDLIPDCHPVPIESVAISFTLSELDIRIAVVVKTIYKTGVEVEAMHTASVVALTIYDMLKPIDRHIEIRHIRLLEKKGGQSDKKEVFTTPLKTSVIVCSDSISQGKKEDKSGKIIIEKLRPLPTELISYTIIPDNFNKIQNLIQTQVAHKTDMVLLTGGTGLALTDVTTEAVKPLLEREIPGLGEVMRQYGQQRTPLAMLSRSTGGFIGNTLVIALPGSTNGVKESMDALFPAVLHVFKMIRGGKH